MTSRRRGDDRRVAVPSADPPDIMARFHAELDLVEVPHAEPEVLPLLTVIPLQMLAYFMADLKGTDVDQPRNLAKTVTVE